MTHTPADDRYPEPDGQVEAGSPRQGWDVLAQPLSPSPEPTAWPRQTLAAAAEAPEPIAPQSGNSVGGLTSVELLLAVARDSVIPRGLEPGHPVVGGARLAIGMLGSILALIIALWMSVTGSMVGAGVAVVLLLGFVALTYVAAGDGRRPVGRRTRPGNGRQGPE